MGLKKYPDTPSIRDFFYPHSLGRSLRPVTEEKGGVKPMTRKFDNGVEYKLIICRYITRNGKRIYPKSAKAFRFWVRA